MFKREALGKCFRGFIPQLICCNWVRGGMQSDDEKDVSDNGPDDNIEYTVLYLSRKEGMSERTRNASALSLSS